jgi:hypothetical protein
MIKYYVDRVFTHVNCPQAMLFAIGVGAANALPLAATLNWILKDGLGQVLSFVSIAVG